MSQGHFIFWSTEHCIPQINISRSSPSDWEEETPSRCSFSLVCSGAQRLLGKTFKSKRRCVKWLIASGHHSRTKDLIHYYQEENISCQASLTLQVCHQVCDFFLVQGLDEVQAYILLRRWCQASGADIADEGLSLDQRMELCISYFTERSCLLTCVEYILQSQAQGEMRMSLSTRHNGELADKASKRCNLPWRQDIAHRLKLE